jgi:hypothetical protein
MRKNKGSIRERKKEKMSVGGSREKAKEGWDPMVSQVASNTSQLPADWLCTGRYFIREGSDVWQWVKSKWKRRFFVLFSDCLLFCREKLNKRYDLLILIWFSTLQSPPKPVNIKTLISSTPAMNQLPSLAPKDSMYWQITDDIQTLILSDFTWLNDVSLAVKALQAARSETLPPLELQWSGITFFLFSFFFFLFSFFFFFLLLSFPFFLKKRKIKPFHRKTSITKTNKACFITNISSSSSNRSQ